METLTDLSKKLDHIETFLKKIDNKIENFMGFEQLSKKEEKEINELLKDKETYSYDEVFG